MSMPTAAMHADTWNSIQPAKLSPKAFSQLALLPEISDPLMSHISIKFAEFVSDLRWRTDALVTDSY
jgi:hypothetical protein